MSRLGWLALLVIVAEVAVGGWLAARRAGLRQPPAIRYESFDPLSGEALRKAREACNPAAAADWIELGTALAGYGYFPEAEACYREGARLAPDNGEAWHLHGFTLGSVGRAEEAIKAFQGALEHGHDRPAEDHFFIGRTYLRLENAKAAREAFERAGDLPAARYELAKLEVRGGDPARAAAILERLEQEFPKAYAPPWLRSRAEQLLGHDAVAHSLLVKADRRSHRLPTPFDRHSDRVYNTRNQTGLSKYWHDCAQLLSQRQLAEAKIKLLRGLQIHWAAQGADLLVDVEIDSRQIQAARQLLEQVVQRDGATLRRMWRLGDAYQMLGQKAEAEKTWLHGIALGPESQAADLYDKLSQSRHDAGDEEGAHVFQSQANYARGMASFWNADYPAAVRQLRESLSVFPGNAHAWYYLGQSLEANGDAAGARSAYQQCLKVFPNHGRTADALARLPS